MTTDDGDGELRARVQDAVGELPGPDRGRLAAIEHRLPGRRRHRPRLVPLLLGIGLAGAAAAGWYAYAPGVSDQDPAAHSDQSVDRGEESGRDTASEDAAAQPEDREHSPKDDSADGDRGRPLIYQR